MLFLTIGVFLFKCADVKGALWSDSDLMCPDSVAPEGIVFFHPTESLGSVFEYDFGQSAIDDVLWGDGASAQGGASVTDDSATSPKMGAIADISGAVDVGALANVKETYFTLSRLALTSDVSKPPQKAIQKAKERYEQAEMDNEENSSHAAAIAARSDTLLSGWCAHKNTPLKIHHLLDFSHVSDKKEKRGQFYMRRVLGLVLDGVPIEYDKDTQTLTLLKEKKKIFTPPAGDNLITLVCDLYRLYKQELFLIECAYYAHKYGYWQNGFDWHWGEKKHFCACLEKCKQILTILEFLSVDVFPLSMQGKMASHVSLWRRIKKDNAIYDVSVYNKDGGLSVTQEDLELMRGVVEFTESEEYRIFAQNNSQFFVMQKKPLRQISAQERIKRHVRLGAKSVSELWFLCRSFMDKNKDFWPAITDLMCAKGEERLFYEIEKGIFSWKSSDLTTEKLSEDYVVEAFCLQADHPHVSKMMCSNILKQVGFENASRENLRIVQLALVLIGLQFPDKHCTQLAEQRRVLNEKAKNELQYSGEVLTLLNERYMRVCSRAFSWMNLQYMPRLWRAYLKRKTAEHGERSEEEPPVLKRKKVENKLPNAKEIIMNEMPYLYKFLQKIGVNINASV